MNNVRTKEDEVGKDKKVGEEDDEETPLHV